MTRTGKLGILFATVLCTSPIILIAFQEGPDPSNTAAPGENPSACARSGCHAAVGNPTVGSGVEVTFVNGLTYTPGVRQTLKVRVTNPQRVGSPNGFQLSIRPISNPNTQAGELISTDGNTRVICQIEFQKPCNPAAPVQFIEHTLTGSTNGPIWTFDWTPPDSNVGNLGVYVAGNAANGNSDSTGDHIFLNSYILTPVAAQPAPQIRANDPVLQAFIGGARMSPGTWIEIYGTNLAPSVQDWNGFLTNNNTVAPTTINGVSVNIDNKPAFLFYTSPTQINAQVPDGIGEGPVTVEVVTQGGRASTTVNASKTSPALLTTPTFNVGGKQYVAALHALDLNAGNVIFVGKANLIPGAAFRPAKPGDILTIFAVGCGVSDPIVVAGVAVSGLHTLPNAQVRIGQSIAVGQGFMSPNNIGLCQFNVTVPNLAAGDYPIDATVNNVDTGQGLQITVQP